MNFSPRRLLLQPLLPLLLQFLLSRAQQLPDNPCAAYFQYVQDGSGSGGIQGELTLTMQNGRNRIDMRFSQRGRQDVRSSHPTLSLSLHSPTFSFSQPFVIGEINPYPDHLTMRANFPAGKFRVRLFPDASGLVPKLTRLLFNEATLCMSSDCE